MSKVAKNLFQRRHYNFLLDWAVVNISPRAAVSLSDVLQADNKKFDRDKFLGEYVKGRNFVRAHERMHKLHAPKSEATLEHPDPGPALMRALKRSTRLVAAGEALADPFVKPRFISGLPLGDIPWRQDQGVMVPVEQVEQVEARAVAGKGESFDAYLARHKQEAIDAGVDSFFQHHNCWKCSDGRHPDKCPSRGQGVCEYPRATND